MQFPLAEWFDISKPITKSDVETASAQMSLYALKDGLEPYGPEWQEEDQKLRQAVKAHNKRIRKGNRLEIVQQPVKTEITSKPEEDQSS